MALALTPLTAFSGMHVTPVTASPTPAAHFGGHSHVSRSDSAAARSNGSSRLVLPGVLAAAMYIQKKQRTSRSNRGSLSLNAQAEASSAVAEEEGKAKTEGGADAKAPPKKASTKKIAPFDPKAQPGVTEPLGYFDPLGFCPPGDPGKFRNLRAAELKHGRVAMLASIGLVAQHFIRFPGFDEVPSGIHAIEKIDSVNGINIVPGIYGFWFLVLFVVPVFEFRIWNQDINKEPGDFGDPLGLGMYDTEMRNRELNNGRAAMFATLGIIAAEFVSGKDAVEQLGF